MSRIAVASTFTLGKPVGGDNPMPRQMAAQRIHQKGSLPHQEVARPKIIDRAGYSSVFNATKRIVGLGDRLDDRPGVGGVVLRRRTNGLT